MANRRLERRLSVGLGLLAGLLILAGWGAALPADQAQQLERAFVGPSGASWLGFDAYGVPVSDRVVAGAWHSLWMAGTVTGAVLAIGLCVGTTAALAPRWIGVALTHVIDCMLAFPGLLLAILVASIMPHSSATIALALATTGWAGRARFVRALVSKVAAQPHIEAARAAGAGRLRIVLRHIWPGIAGQLLVQAALSMGYVILAEASLSFLGLGGAVGNPSWGQLIAEGRNHLVEAPHLSVVPGVAFILTVFAFNLTAEGLRNRLDPLQDVRVY